MFDLQNQRFGFGGGPVRSVVLDGSGGSNGGVSMSNGGNNPFLFIIAEIKVGPVALTHIRMVNIEKSGTKTVGGL